VYISNNVAAVIQIPQPTLGYSHDFSAMSDPMSPVFTQASKAVLRNNSSSKGPMTDSAVTQIHSTGPLDASDQP